jgi:hypothetical protein
LSPTAFDEEVAAGTFPQHFPRARVRRRLWDIKAIDVAIDKAMGLQSKHADWERRKREWQEQQVRRRPGLSVSSESAKSGPGCAANDAHKNEPRQLPGGV